MSPAVSLPPTPGWSRSWSVGSPTGPRRRRLGVVWIGLFVGWVVWFLFAEVGLYEVTEKARLEIKSAAHVVATPVGGAVVENRLTIGRQVAAGAVDRGTGPGSRATPSRP